MPNRDEHYRRLERMYLAAPANEYFRPEIQIAEGTVSEGAKSVTEASWSGLPDD